MTQSSKRRWFVITLLVVATAAGLPRLRRLRAASDKGQPQDTVFNMLDAARAGDANRYLNSFTGLMRASLRQSYFETANADFASYLRESNAAVKGVAVSDLQVVSGDEVEIRVEYIYQDRKEAQTLHLDREKQGWKIARIESDERLPVLIPYGTPVTARNAKQ